MTAKYYTCITNRDMQQTHWLDALFPLGDSFQKDGSSNNALRMPPRKKEEK